MPLSAEGHERISKDVVQRTYDFLERKESKIRELESRVLHDFQPQRVHSRLSHQVNEQALSARGRRSSGNIGEQLLEEGQRLEERKERRRQQLAVDPNCTFKPQLSKKGSASRSALREVEQYYSSHPDFN